MDARDVDRLLLMLAEKLNCNYVSDLHGPAIRCRLLGVIKPLYGKYPPAVWNRALSYILNEPVECQTLEELSRFFQKNTAAAR